MQILNEGVFSPFLPVQSNEGRSYLLMNELVSCHLQGVLAHKS